MFFLGLSIMFNDSTTLKVPISKPPLLTPAVSMVILICWLSLVLIGKFIKQAHILPYRYQFHAFTTMIACIASFDLLFTALLLPAFSVWGVLALYGTFVITGHFIHSVAVDRLIKRLYNPAISLKSSDMLLSKIAICLCVLGAGLSLFLKGYTIDSPTSLPLLGVVFIWMLINIGAIAVAMLIGYPYFLQAYYKLKYSEEYREWEGESLEAWYGKKYLRKHKELLELKLEDSAVKDNIVS